MVVQFTLFPVDNSGQGSSPSSTTHIDRGQGTEFGGKVQWSLACPPCTRGHRSNTCKHVSAPTLTMLRKRGRIPSQCSGCTSRRSGVDRQAKDRTLQQRPRQGQQHHFCCCGSLVRLSVFGKRIQGLGENNVTEQCIQAELEDSFGHWLYDQLCGGAEIPLKPVVFVDHMPRSCCDTRLPISPAPSLTHSSPSPPPLSCGEGDHVKSGSGDCNRSWMGSMVVMSGPSPGPKAEKENVLKMQFLPTTHLSVDETRAVLALSNMATVPMTPSHRKPVYGLSSNETPLYAGYDKVPSTQLTPNLAINSTGECDFTILRVELQVLPGGQGGGFCECREGGVCLCYEVYKEQARSAYRALSRPNFS